MELKDTMNDWNELVKSLGGSDDEDKETMDIILDLNKSKKDLAKLHPVKKEVTRNGRTFVQTVYVSGDDKSKDNSKMKVKDGKKNDLEDEIKELSADLDDYIKQARLVHGGTPHGKALNEKVKETKAKLNALRDKRDSGGKTEVQSGDKNANESPKDAPKKEKFNVRMKDGSFKEVEGVRDKINGLDVFFYEANKGSGHYKVASAVTGRLLTRNEDAGLENAKKYFKKNSGRTAEKLQAQIEEAIKSGDVSPSYKAEIKAKSDVEGIRLEKIKNGEPVVVHYRTEADRIRQLAQKQGIELDVKYSRGQKAGEDITLSLKEAPKDAPKKDEKPKDDSKNVNVSKPKMSAIQIQKHLRPIRKTLGTEKYKEYLKANGIKWEENKDNPGADTMRASMAAKKWLEEGNQLNDDVYQKMLQSK